MPAATPRFARRRRSRALPPSSRAVKNGRLAMLAVLGEMMAQQVSGMGTYEQLGAIADSLPF